MNKRARERLQEAVSSVEEGATEEKTGTTTLGVLYDSGVVVAADRQTSLIGGGTDIRYHDKSKIMQIQENVVLTSVGIPSIPQYVAKALRQEVRIQKARNNRKFSVETHANYVANLFMPHVSPVLAGVDEDGPQLYRPGHGSVLVQDSYGATGSGGREATAVLDSEYSHGLSESEAREIAIRAVRESVHRDNHTGAGIDIAVITEGRIEQETVETYDGLRS